MQKKNKKRRKSPYKKKATRKGKSSFRKRSIFILCIGFLVLCIGFYFRHSLRFYYKMYFSPTISNVSLSNSKYETARIQKIVEEYKDKTFGIDISHYQRKEDIHWEELSIANGAVSIDFVVLRATMGNRSKDQHFHYFWKQAKKHNKIRGAYHFYRANEDPVLQARNFLATVKLESGDLPPVLDIEKVPTNKTKEELVRDLKIWCSMVEKKYGKKPIIYTYYHYYKDYLRGDFSGYVLWLANYNDVLQPSLQDNWDFWQFTEKGIVNGIQTKVDVDIYNGSLSELKKLTID